MRRSRKVVRVERLPRRLTEWGVTFVVIIGLFASLSVAYTLMVGEAPVSAAAKRANRSTFVEGVRTPTPAHGQAG